MAMSLEDLGDVPARFADCCVAISKPLIQAISARLPPHPATVLSVGSGSGLLESLLVKDGAGEVTSPLNLFGVEVPSCVNKHLRQDRLLRVSSTSCVYADAVFAEALIFVYPRQVSLIAQYLQICLGGMLEILVWFGHRSDWADAEDLLSSSFSNLEYVDIPGIAEYELLVVATERKTRDDRHTTDS